MSTFQLAAHHRPRSDDGRDGIIAAEGLRPSSRLGAWRAVAPVALGQRAGAASASILCRS